MMTAPRSLPARVMAWLMIVLMASPVPAMAQVSNTPVRDTAIYLAQVPGSTSEPNIMLVMTANDRMNVAEPWREVPGDYDSHIEYLWASPGLIRPSDWITSTDFTASVNNSPGSLTSGISLRPVPANPTSVWGNWGGETHADRLALANAAYNSTTTVSALAFPLLHPTETNPDGSPKLLDPGPRWLYRNYGGGQDAGATSAGGHVYYWTGDANWLWWAPAGTAETSPLLWAPSFNKFVGNIRKIGGTRGNVNYGGTEDWRTYNQCSASRSSLTANTVFAPSSEPRNAGRFLNQSWLRWEPYQRLDTSRVSLFPTTAPSGTVIWPTSPITGARRIADISGATLSGTWPRSGGLSVNPYPNYASTNVANPLSSTSLISDGGPSWLPEVAPQVYRPGAGDQQAFNMPGLAGAPIRMRIDEGTRDVVDPDDSHAGWTWLRADLGGHTHWWNGIWYHTAFFNGVSQTSNSPFRRVLEVYGLPGLTLAANAGLQQAYMAMRGNLHVPGVDWWKRTGLAGYFSTSIARGSITAGTNQLKIDRRNAFRPADERYGLRINVPGAGPLGGNLVAAVSGIDVDGLTLTLDQNAVTTVADTVVTVNLRVYDRGQAQCIRNCTTSPAPVSGTPHVGGTASYTVNSTATCVMSGSLVATQPGACGGVTPPACPGLSAGQAVTTVSRSGCVWSGRQSVFIEGIGTRFHGGQCVATCSAAFPDASACIHGPVSANYCGAPTAGSATVGGVTYTFYNDQNNGQGGGCGAPIAVSNVARNCHEREPGFNSVNLCTYNRVCAQASTSITESITTVPATDLAVVNRAEATNYFVHDCLADNGTSGNPAGSFLNTSERRFGTQWNTGVGTAASGTQPYRPSDPGGSAPPPIDVYSANYLNWKFGPRGPQGHPIGRATRITLAKSALTDLVRNTNGVRFGLIVSNRTRADTSNDGANVVFAARRMGTGPSDPDFANRQALINAINNVQALSRTPLTESLYEAMLYYAGRAPQWGTDTSAAWVGGTVSQGRDTTAVCSAVGPDCPAVGVYRSPMLSNPTAAEPSSCQKNFVVLITNGLAEEDSSANTIGAQGIRNLRYSSQTPQPVGTISPVTGVDSFNSATASGQFVNPATGLPYGQLDQAGTSVDGGYLWLDELAYFMRNADMSPGARIFPTDATTDRLEGFQGVITYVVGFRGNNSPVLQQAAQRGDGLYYEATDATDLRNKLQQAITNITSFSGTLAAATVPLASYNRSESGLDVYMSFFEPSANRLWRGTVKRYRLGLTQAECGTNADGTPNTFCLMGQTTLAGGTRNIVTQEPLGTTGLLTEVINSLAVSFWNPITEVDGRDPARGGTGFQLRSQGATYTPNNRRLYTKLSTVATNDLTASANQLTVGNSLITTSLLGLSASDTAGRERLIKFIRGGDMAQASCNGASPGAACTSWAPWAHADALHSKVAQVYYDLGTTPPVQTLFYLTNDGLLHAVDANTGREQWAFLVEEALPQLQAMQINGNGQQIQAADGSPAVFVRDDNADGIINGADQVILVFNLRRGGRSMYALDVTAPAAPRFLWKITGEGGGQLCTGGSCASQPLYSELGQTWSAPVVARANGYANPVAIFGGGYDPNQDNEPVTVNDTMGRAVYVVDLLTGAPVRRLDSTSVANSVGSMTHSVASAPSVFDLNGDRKADVIYIGDTGGRLFRFQITDLDPNNWSGRLLARLSNATPANRKILFPPTVVPYVAGGQRVYAVFVGTGDREHPFKLNAADVVAMIVDRDVTNTLSTSAPVDFDSASLVKLAWDDQASQVSVTSGVDGWARLLPPTVKVTESANVQSDLLRVPVYGRASELGVAALASTCTPSFISRLLGYSGLESKIVVLPGSSTRSQIFQGNIAQNFIGAPQVLFLPDGRIVLFSSGGAAGIGAVQQIGQRNVARIRSYWYVDPN